MAVLDNVTLTISLGFGSGPLAVAPSWTDITPYVKAWNTSRGRSSVLDRFDAGTGTILVENMDGRFDPINTSSPYTPNLKIGVPVRIQVVHSAVTYTLFRGMVDSYPIDYSHAGQYSELAIPIIDLYPLLAGTSMTGVVQLDGQETVSRMINMFNEVGLDSFGSSGGEFRDLDIGVGIIANTDVEGDSVADHIQSVVDVEAGAFFVSADGKATFQKRTAQSGLASTGTFGPGGGSEIPYTEFARAYDRDQLFNIVEVTRIPGETNPEDGVPQVATDATSVADHGPLTLFIDGPFVDDTAAMNVAEWQVARLANTVNRITELSFDPDESPTLAWPIAAGTDLREGVTVKFTPPGGGTTINQLCSVEGIDHSVSDDEVWTTTFRLWPLATIETQGYWIIGTSALDTTTRAA